MDGNNGYLNDKLILKEACYIMYIISHSCQVYVFPYHYFVTVLFNHIENKRLNKKNVSYQKQ